MKHVFKVFFKIFPILLYTFTAVILIIIAIWFWNNKYLDIMIKINDEILGE